MEDKKIKIEKADILGVLSIVGNNAVLKVKLLS
jgi:hypothetical protein